ncbi:glycosyltransferase family 2 protein [Roseovarius amoyensis]|uniref:glycosyltransferase family 2 protein n=1 Tax=Roseovarius amoyensis TaxID=2211448 RepID=UPI000DBE9A4D|nr:glycosyltransferase family 2 protein [Roseovarius amoyensis]
MKFSICIPNYNYGRYIGETIRSALDQAAEVEVLVSDNASTDESVAVIEGIGDARVRLRRNRWNVGFAGNLDRACADATGERMILLSSDDLADSGALAAYERLARELGSASERAVFCSATHVIDGTGRVTGAQRLDARLWADAVEDEELSKAVGERVLRVPARTLLARALAHMRNPFCFATTCYSRALYEAVEGYGGGALINPDKAFAWKLLSVADEVFHIYAPLFSYRVHDANQTAQQRQSGALKHLIDQYRATFDTAPDVLLAAGMSRDDLARAFVEHDVALRGLVAVAEDERYLARRQLNFGRAAYPALIRRSRRVWMLRIALALGPLGSRIARWRLKSALASYRAGGVIGTGSAVLAHG